MSEHAMRDPVVPQLVLYLLPMMRLVYVLLSFSCLYRLITSRTLFRHDTLLGVKSLIWDILHR